MTGKQKVIFALREDISGYTVVRETDYPKIIEIYGLGHTVIYIIIVINVSNLHIGFNKNS